MGVKGLYSYLKHYRNEIDPREQPPRRIGIDAMSILYRFKGDKEEIKAMLNGLKGVGNTILFVFDGKPPAEKEREIQSRKDAKTEAASQAESIGSFLRSDGAKELDSNSREVLEVSLQRCQNQSWHMTREMRREFQEELWNMDIPYVKSVSEADDVLIDLVAAGKIDTVISTDMDYLLGGVKVLWIPTKKATFHFEELRQSEILEGENLMPMSLIDAGLLCGSEERQVKGVPCSVAFTWMSHYGSLEALLKSSVRDATMRKLFPDTDAIFNARFQVAPKAVYSRIRPDHYERIKEFLDSL
jgi:5'-3' exonuclease